LKQDDACRAKTRQIFHLWLIGSREVRAGLIKVTPLQLYDVTIPAKPEAQHGFISTRCHRKLNFDQVYHQS